MKLRVLAATLLLGCAPPLAGESSPFLVENASPETRSYPLAALLPSSLRALGGYVLFEANDGSQGPAIWSLDVATGELAYLSDKATGFEHAVEGAGFLLWLTAREWDDTYVLVTDGTPQGTLELMHAPSVSPSLADDPRLAAGAGELVLFAGFDEAAGWEPWTTDGTLAGTRRLADLLPGPWDSDPHDFVAGDGFVCFDFWNDEEQVGCSHGLLDGVQELGYEIGSRDTLTAKAAVDGRIVFESLGFDRSSLWVTGGTPASTFELTPASTGVLHVSDVVPLGDRGYFLATDPASLRELWETDGRPAGTRRITEFAAPTPIDGPLDPDTIARLGSSVVFRADDGESGPSLWRTTGDPASTARLELAPPGCDESEVEFVATIDSTLLFPARCDVDGSELRSIDLDAASTFSTVVDACPGPCSGAPERPVPASGLALFEAGLEEDRELYVSDGTAEGTRRLTEIPDGSAQTDDASLAPLLLEDRIWFAAQAAATGSELWSVPLGGGEASPATNLDAQAHSSAPTALLPFGDGVLFARCRPVDEGIWSFSDGGPEGVIDLAWMAGCDTRQQSVDLGGVALLSGFAPTYLWKSDGSASGTEPLVPAIWESWSRLAVDSGIAWWIRTRTGGIELWRTDGTPAGTRYEISLPAGLDHSNGGLVAAGGRLLFVSPDGNHPSRAVAYDAAHRTFEILPPDLEISGGVPRDREVFVRWRGALHFVGTEGDASWLYRYGLEDGALTRGVELPAELELWPLVAGDDLLLLARDAEGRVALWTTDGTPHGTHEVRALGESAFSLIHSVAPSPVAIPDGWLFRLRTDASGSELWMTDGTSGGTAPVPEPSPGEASSAPTPPVVAGPFAYFGADGPVHGVELYRLDLLTGELARRSDIAPGARPAAIEQVAAAGERLFFGADDGLHGNELWALDLDGEGCLDRPHDLCLNQGRFQVSASWRDFLGQSGDGAAVPLTSDTGYFWFFDESNVETVVKVLDAIGVNQRYWVFYGALSNVEYTIDVVDTATRIKRRYFNPPGRYASIGDTDAFDPFASVSAAPRNEIEAPATDGRPTLVDALVAPAAAIGPCEPSELRLCLQQGRFAVEATWRDFEGHSGVGTAVPLSADTGYFWFFVDTNVEAIVKVLDGRPLNERYWVYYGALSNVEYTLTVTDTLTGAVRSYFNPAGRFASVGDNDAF